MPGFHGWANVICREWNVLNCNRAVADTPAFRVIILLDKWYSWSRSLKSSPHFSHIPSQFLEGFGSRWESVLWYMSAERMFRDLGCMHTVSLWESVHWYMCEGSSVLWTRVNAHCQSDNWIKGENTKSVQRKAKCVSSRAAGDWGHTSTRQKAIGECSRAQPRCWFFHMTVSYPEKDGAYGERPFSTVLQNSFVQRLTRTGLNFWRVGAEIATQIDNSVRWKDQANGKLFWVQITLAVFCLEASYVIYSTWYSNYYFIKLSRQLIYKRK